MAGPGDFTRGADELDLHGSLEDGDGELVRVRARHVRFAPRGSGQVFRAETSARCFCRIGSSSFGIGLALKNYRQALLVLRHHRWLPTTTHPLVE